MQLSGKTTDYYVECDTHLWNVEQQTSVGLLLVEETYYYEEKIAMLFLLDTDCILWPFWNVPAMNWEQISFVHLVKDFTDASICAAKEREEFFNISKIFRCAI